MRINEVQNKKVNVTLDSDELVLIGNLMYFYETNLKLVEPDNSGPTTKFHELYSSVILARDLCQYGGLDSFSMKHMVKHKIAADPNGRLAEFREILEKGEEKDES